LTTVGQLMGTLDYMAPEQGDNSHDVDARADVYSLGATLFKLLTATAPYDSPGTRTPLAKMKALATIDAPSVAERRSELPADLVAVVDRALLRNVDDRFTSAKELADSLVPFCEGHVLSDLAECGRDLALREDEKIP
jgi:serine/threonine protein kinase